MQFKASAEMAAPKRFAWKTIVRPEIYEDRLRGRGLPVARHPAEGELAVGTRWVTRIGLLSAMRDLEVTVTDIEAPSRLTLEGNTFGVKIVADLRLSRPADDRSKLDARVTFSQTSLGGRALLISLRLGEGALQHRLDAQVADMAGRVADQFGRMRERQLRLGSAG